MNYYQHHLGDYAKDTGHLSMLEHGAYRILLDRYYSTECGIPEQQVYRIARARTDEEKAAVDAVLSEFFILEKPTGFSLGSEVYGVWVNRRAEEELAKAESRITAARNNGKKGGRPQKNPDETQEKPTGFSVGSPDETQEKAHQSPVTSKREEITPLPPTEDLPEEPEATATRRGALAGMLIRSGVTITSQHPDLCQWVNSEITDAEAIDAVQRARQCKPLPKQIPAKYLAAIVAQVIAERDDRQKKCPASAATPQGQPSSTNRNRGNQHVRKSASAQRQAISNGLANTIAVSHLQLVTPGDFRDTGEDHPCFRDDVGQLREPLDYPVSSGRSDDNAYIENMVIGALPVSRKGH